MNPRTSACAAAADCGASRALRFRAACMAAQTDTADVRETTVCHEPELSGSDVTRLAAEDRGRLLVQILAKERRRLERFAIRAAGGMRADGEDVFQQACLQFCRAYPGGPNPLGWLFVAIRNEASHIHRQRKRRREASLHCDPARPGDGSSDPWALLECDGAGVDELVVRREEVRLVGRVMEGLKPDERRALVLFGYGYSVEPSA